MFPNWGKNTHHNKTLSFYLLKGDMREDWVDTVSLNDIQHISPVICTLLVSAQSYHPCATSSPSHAGAHEGLFPVPAEAEHAAARNVLAALLLPMVPVVTQQAARNKRTYRLFTSHMPGFSFQWWRKGFELTWLTLHWKGLVKTSTILASGGGFLTLVGSNILQKCRTQLMSAYKGFHSFLKAQAGNSRFPN